MIFEEDTYCQVTGYEKDGEIGSRVDYLLLNVVFTVKELEDYVKKQAENTSSYSKKKFSFVKCLPMSYNTSIETKVSISV